MTANFLDGEEADSDTVGLEWSFVEAIKDLTIDQKKDILNVMYDIAGQLDPDDERYIPFSNGKRDLIAAVADVNEDLSDVKRLFIKSILLKPDDEFMDEVELIKVNKLLRKSAKRQLLGKAYELLDAQTN